MAEKIIEKLGKYEIVEVLGRGAMGIVYKARDPFIGRLVALKTINSKLLQEGDLLKRFYREAQAAGNLQHPNIVTIFELGEAEGVPFIAMELLDGEGLDRVVARHDPIPLARKLNIITQFCRGLDYAHKHGVVHRDIKPANIVVAVDGHTKVVDFGIVHLTTATMTSTGLIMGTVYYMSPEQLRGDRVDARSDIFSVGIVIYEFLSYRKAFQGADLGEVMAKIVSQEPLPLGEAVPGIPAALEEAVNKCLSKNPDERFQSLEDLILELDPITRSFQRDLVVEMVKQAQELADKSEFAQARDILRNALALDSSYDLAKNLMGRVLSELKRTEISTRIQPHLDRAQQLLNEGRYDEVKRTLEGVLKLDPQNTQARALIESAEKQAAHVAEARQNLKAGQQALEEGDLTLAEHLLKTTLVLDSQNPEAPALLAKVREARSLRDRRMQMREAVWRAGQMVAEGRFEEALAQLGEFQKEFAGDQDLQQAIGDAREGVERRRRVQEETAAIQALIESQEYGKAAERAKSAHGEFPQDAQLTRLFESAANLREEAQQHQRVKSEVAPLWQMVDAGQYDQAIERAEQLLREYRDSPEVSSVLVVACREKLLAEERKVAVICQSIQALQQQGKFGEAIREATAALRLFRDNPDIERELDSARKGLEEQVREENRRKEEVQLKEEQRRRDEKLRADEDERRRREQARLEEEARLREAQRQQSILQEAQRQEAQRQEEQRRREAEAQAQARKFEEQKTTRRPVQPTAPAPATTQDSNATSWLRAVPEAPRREPPTPALPPAPPKVEPWKAAPIAGSASRTIPAGGAPISPYPQASPTGPAGPIAAVVHPAPPKRPLWKQPAAILIPAGLVFVIAVALAYFRFARGTSEVSKVGQVQSQPVAPQPKTVPEPQQPAVQAPNPPPSPKGLSAEDLETLQRFQAELNAAIQQNDQQALEKLLTQANTIASSGAPLAEVMNNYAEQIEDILTTLPSKRSSPKAGQRKAGGAAPAPSSGPVASVPRENQPARGTQEAPPEKAPKVAQESSPAAAEKHPGTETPQGTSGAPPQTTAGAPTQTASSAEPPASVQTSAPSLRHPEHGPPAGTKQVPAVIYPAVRDPVSAGKYFLTYSLAMGSQYLGTIAISPEVFRFSTGNSAGSLVLPISQIQSVKGSALKRPPVAAPNMTGSLEIKTVDGRKFHFAVQDTPDKPEALALLRQAVGAASGDR